MGRNIKNGGKVVKSFENANFGGGVALKPYVQPLFWVRLH